MFCCISGEVPAEPVVSKKSGHLFDRRVIEKYLEHHERCPITNEAMVADDLQPVVTTQGTRPRPANATSVPGLLSLLQNEWDALMIEQYTMKQHLDTVRQELSHALYQHDAACRVIARLIRERDAARAALANQRLAIEEAREEQQASREMEVEEEGKLPGDVVKEMTNTSSQLIAQRRKRKVADGLASVEQIELYEQTKTYNPHSTNPAGVRCIDIGQPFHNFPAPAQNLIATGGMDGVVALYDRTKGKIAAKLEGHNKPVRVVRQHPSQKILLSASEDNTSRMWGFDGKTWGLEHVFNEHTGAVTGLSINGTSKYYATSSLDGTWGFYDIEKQQCLLHYTEDQAKYNSGFTCCQFHPDALIYGTGVGSSVVIWDVKEGSALATLPQAQGTGHSADITSISFSENGYWLATGSKDGTVRMWDLRHIASPSFQTLTFEDSNPSKPTPVNNVVFDYSSNYLCVAANNVKVYKTKKWEEVKVFDDGKAGEAVMDVAIGADFKWLASAGMDRHVRLYSEGK